MENNIFMQLSLLFAITVSIAFFVRLLRQPLIVAYIIAGIFGGPLFLNLLEGGNNMYEAFAQFGIVLLLFVLGLNLDFNYLKKIGWISGITGVGQIVFTFVFGTAILLAMDFALFSAAYLAVAITFSSTIIIVKLLNDKRDTESIYGRYVIGLMLVQDVIAILILIFIGVATDGGNLAGLLEVLLVKGSAVTFIIFLVSKYILPKFLNKIADNGEFLFIFTITWCFGVASAIHWAGLSIEIGAVVAGLTLGSSHYQRAIISKIKPLRDFFIMLFFIILGSQMGVADFNKVIGPGLVISVFILLGNPLILYLLFRLFKFTRQNSFLAGITAAQVSEFGFILLFVGQSMGHVNTDVLPVFTMVALITIFISSYLITYNKQLFRIFLPLLNIFGKDRYSQKIGKENEFDVWVFGYHRIGWKVCEALREKEEKFAVVDFNQEAIIKLEKRGMQAFFGDVSDIEFLEMLPLEKSKMIISTLPDYEAQLTFISHVRTRNKKTLIVATLNHRMPLEDLYQAGADYVMMPHLLGGVLIYDMLKKDQFNRKFFSNLRKKQQGDTLLRNFLTSDKLPEIRLIGE